MADTQLHSGDDYFERAYLAPDESEARSESELAAARALATYRDARQAGRAVSVDDLVRAAPFAANQIKAAIEAYDFINDAGSQPPSFVARSGYSPDTFPRIPGYEVLRVIGQGGMGVVYAAVQQSLQRPVAIKILAPHLESHTEVISRFVREIHLMTRLTHPNIVDIYDAGVTDGRHYYVMEYIDGLSLERIIRKHRVRPQTAVAILKQMVAGLKAAHRQGILHRDLKPGNILLDRNAVVRIADFGLAAIAPHARDSSDSSTTRAGRRLGTAGYMSPEQLEDVTACDERSDIYSVGVIFYQMLTGQLPTESFAPASELVPGLTRQADRLIELCLKADPTERFQSTELLLESTGKLERRMQRTRAKQERLLRGERDPEAEVDESEEPLATVNETVGDADLMRVIQAWTRLPAPLKAAIMAIVQSAE